MSLLTRLTVPLEGEEKIPAHQFVAAIYEFKRGAPGVNAARIQQEFNLSAQELAELTAWYTANIAPSTPPIPRDLLHDILLLVEKGHYSVDQARVRLNIAK